MKALSLMNRSNIFTLSVLKRNFTHSSIRNIDRSIDRWKVKKILESDDSIIGNEVIVKGWVRTIRNQKKISFIEVNDGSFLTGIQVVADGDIDSYSEISKLSTGAATEVLGTIVKSVGKNQKYEIQVKDIKLVGRCPIESYPLQKKRHSQEFLRTIAHLRPRTNTISAVARVRLSYIFHFYLFLSIYL
jgi:asparaginyl-tRNA synthetase